MQFFKQILSLLKTKYMMYFTIIFFYTWQGIVLHLCRILFGFMAIKLHGRALPRVVSLGKNETLNLISNDLQWLTQG